MGGRKCKSKSTKHKRQQRQSEETNGHLNNNNNTGNDDPYDPDWDVQEKPINVKISPIMGRYLVASRDIAPGELILSEETLVVGPCQNTEPVCLGCLKKFDGENYIRCMGCQWPLCSPRCPGLDGRLTGHTPEECAALSANGPSGRRVQKLHGRTPLYNVIVPLRILLLEQQDLARYKAIRKMQSHDEVRRKIPAVWQANQLGVVNRIREEFGLQHFKDDEIHSICGILEVNAFEVGSGLRALFDVAFLLSHDCTPNTSHSDDEHRTLIVRASVAIPRGEAITLSYAYTIQGTLKRREHLKESKFFDCCCARCADPTELGTMCSALMCTRCGRPSVLPEEPLRPESPWRCTADPACPFEMPAVEAKKFLDRLADEAEAANPNDVPGLEATLTKYANQLHPNHYHLLGVKHSLSQVYGKVHGYLILDMSNELLERKLSICKDIMRIFDIIEPGITRLRGITLYEMHAPIMILTTRLYEASSINRKDLRTRLRKVASCLEQAAHILGFEPESSSEGATGRAAKEALERVNLWQ